MTASSDRPPDEPRPWDRAHGLANDQGQDGYFDPDTGLFVMTEGYLLRREYCCNSGCRHCPYAAD